MDLDIKQPAGQLLLGIGAFGIVLASTASGLSARRAAIGQPVNFSAIEIKQEQPEPAESNDFAHYKSAQFSVDYPQGWQIDPVGDSGLTIASIADGVNMPIRTQIVMLRENPETAVPQRLDQIVAEAAAVERYSLVAVDGQSGFRIWYQPAAGQRALITFVGYGVEQTVVLSSQYAQDAEAEDLVTQIHSSFINHSVDRGSRP